MRNKKKKYYKNPRVRRIEALVDSILGHFEKKGRITLTGWDQ